MTEASERLFVALDVDTSEEALELVSTLIGCTRKFKIGSQLFTATGPNLVRRVIASGAQVFLDLKFHDIPNTVSAAATAATRLGVYMFNLHASGGREMMKKAVDASAETAAREGIQVPLLIGVTVLTSADDKTLQEVGVGKSMEEQVLALARMSAESGLNGVVASPREAQAVRGSIDLPGFIIVTPGIRSLESANDDQKRIMTPRSAIQAGADYLVVGRPITAARDPLAVCQAVVAEMQEALG